MQRYPGDLLDHLRSFLALADAIDAGKPGPFERAARALRVDTSVLRRRMQSLDGWLGAPLWAGRGAALRLTPAGSTARERARAILAGVDTLRAPSPTTFSLGCTGTVATELVPDLLVRLERSFPAIRVAVRRLGSAACLAELEAGRVDLGVVRAPVAPPGVHAELLSDDRLFLAAPLRHPLLARRRLDLAALSREPLVLYGESSQTRGRVSGLLDLGASVRIEVEGKTAALAYVRRGLGIAFVSSLPRVTLRAPGVAFRDVTHLFAQTRFFVVRARGEPSAWVAAAATDLLRAAREHR